MNKYRAYFKLKIELLSPLAIGTSNRVDTDRDVLLNSRKEPMIPASSIAGVFRGLEKDPVKRKKYFGEVLINNGAEGQQPGEQTESSLKFYDAQLIQVESRKAAITSRDCVKLDEYKTAVPGAKFDFQIVETGVIFLGYIETTVKEGCDYIKEILKKQISFGSKTSRGYGRVKIKYQVQEFPLYDETKRGLDEGILNDWLAFDMFGAYGEEWLDDSSEPTAGTTKIVLALKQRGGLSIRQYLTDPKTSKNNRPPDYGPLALQDGTPVIPGTSWAGMFKHHVSKLLGPTGLEDVEKAFGYVKEKNKTSQKSKVCFNESILRGCQEKVLVRNAIDRFTSGTKEGALYTEKTLYHGKTELEITLSGISEKMICALCATILDLHGGYAALGGLTSVGRGIFAVTGICVNDQKLDILDYTALKEAMLKWIEP